MNWNEFLQKVKDANGKDKISVPAVANLIYCGCFDSMVEEPSLKKYREMFEEFKKIKKSKASLPKKTKTEIIGLDQVTSMFHLAVWRNQKTPVVKPISFEPEVTGPLANYGYQPVNKAGSIFTFIRGEDKTKGRQAVLATPHWSEVFKDSNRLQLFGDRLLMVYGVVTEVNIRRYGEGKSKEMMVLKVFTGHETTDELVVWPKRGSNDISEVYKSELKPGVIAAICVRPSIYKGSPSASVMNFTRFSV